MFLAIFFVSRSFLFLILNNRIKVIIMKHGNSIIFFITQLLLLLYCSNNVCLSANVSSVFDEVLGDLFDKSRNDNTPRNRFQKLKESGKAIKSGSVNAGNAYESMVYDLDEIPSNLQVLTVTFVDKGTSCGSIECGNVKKTFSYRGSTDKKDYLEAVKGLKKKNPEIIILFELNNKVMFDGDKMSAFEHLNEMVEFINEMEFDGINLIMDLSELVEDVRYISEATDFYYSYIVQLMKELGNDKVLALTANNTGVMCSIHNNEMDESDKLNNDDILNYPCFSNAHTHSFCELDLKYTSGRAFTGVAIPLIVKLKDTINMVVVNDGLNIWNQWEFEPFIEYYLSYTIFAALYGFTIQLEYSMRSSKLPLNAEQNIVINGITGAIKSENEMHKRGDGISYTDLGLKEYSSDENSVIGKFTKMLE